MVCQAGHLFLDNYRSSSKVADGLIILLHRDSRDFDNMSLLWCKLFQKNAMMVSLVNISEVRQQLDRQIVNDTLIVVESVLEKAIYEEIQFQRARNLEDRQLKWISVSAFEYLLENPQTLFYWEFLPLHSWILNRSLVLVIGETNEYEYHVITSLNGQVTKTSFGYYNLDRYVFIKDPYAISDSRLIRSFRSDIICSPQWLENVINLVKVCGEKEAKIRLKTVTEIGKVLDGNGIFVFPSDPNYVRVKIYAELMGANLTNDTLQCNVIITSGQDVLKSLSTISPDIKERVRLGNLNVANAHWITDSFRQCSKLSIQPYIVSIGLKQATGLPSLKGTVLRLDRGTNLENCKLDNETANQTKDIIQVNGGTIVNEGDGRQADILVTDIFTNTFPTDGETLRTYLCIYSFPHEICNDTHFPLHINDLKADAFEGYIFRLLDFSIHEQTFLTKLINRLKGEVTRLQETRHGEIQIQKNLPEELWTETRKGIDYIKARAISFSPVTFSWSGGSSSN